VTNRWKDKTMRACTALACTVTY